jgi:hypothetical protein
VAADAGQTEIPANATLSKFDGRLVGNLADVGTASTGENEDVILLAQALLFHVSPPLLYPFLDLFHFGDFPDHLNHPIYYQSRSHQNTVVGDRLDVLDFGDLSVNPQCFDSFFGSLRELIAFSSTHAKDFNLFHDLHLLSIFAMD